MHGVQPVAMPTKYVPEIVDAVIAARRAGKSMEVAAQAGGITKRTLCAWLRCGRDGMSPFDSFLARWNEAAALAFTDYIRATSVRRGETVESLRLRRNLTRSEYEQQAA